MIKISEIRRMQQLAGIIVEAPDDITPGDSTDQEDNTNQQQPNPQSQLNPNPQPQQPQQQDPEIPKELTKEQAVALIRATKGKVFTVTFTKKDGTTRVMNARLGVKAYLRGGELPYNPSEKGLIPVFDMQKRDYRMVSINTIRELKFGNYIFKVK